MNRGKLKDLEFGEGWCRFGTEEIMLCHECIGRKVCWNAQLGGNYEANRMARKKAIDLEKKTGTLPSVRNIAPNSPREKTE